MFKMSRLKIDDSSIGIDQPTQKIHPGLIDPRSLSAKHLIQSSNTLYTVKSQSSVSRCQIGPN